jgi:hypothetical protein
MKMNIDLSDWSSEDYLAALKCVFPEGESSHLEVHPWILKLMTREAEKIADRIDLEELEGDMLVELLTDRLVTVFAVSTIMGFHKEDRNGQ